MGLFQAGRRGDDYAKYTAKLNGEVQGNQFALLDQARQSAGQYFGAGRDYLGRGFEDATRSLAAGNQQAQGVLGNAIGVYDNLAPISTDAQGYDWQGRTAQSRGAYLDALGQNGADGRTRALQNFQAGPGYQFQVDQATDAAARNAAKLGMANSGNAMAALTTLGSNLANQEWGNHLGRLGTLDQLDSGIAAQFSQGNASRGAQAGLAQQAMKANGQASAYGALANQAYGYGRDNANLGTQFGKDMLSSLGGEGGLDLAVAGQKSNLWSDFLKNNLQGAQASVQGSNADDAQMLGLGMGGLSLLAKFAGGGGLGSLGSLFGGGSSSSLW